jgi:hypothetical protein
MSGNNPLKYIYDKDGGGWFGYRGLFALIFASGQFALFAYWVTYTGVTLSAAWFYLTLIPLVFGIIFTGLLPGKSGITPKTFLIYALWSVLAYALYDWVRVPFNLSVGVPFWDHWFDWGASTLGSQGTTIFTYGNLTTGLLGHIIRGWGFAMAYFLLVRRVTAFSAFTFAMFMTIFYWVVFPIFVLTDALPPWIWFFVAYSSHVAFAAGLWLAPKIFASFYKKKETVEAVAVTTSPITSKNYETKDQKEKAVASTYHRSWKTTLYAILAVQGFGLAIGCILFGAIVGSQPPSTYPVFGYGKPPPIVIAGFSSYYWAIPFAIAGFVFSYLARKSRTLLSCSSCGHTNPTDAAFCSHCGSKMPPEV